jgi:hypothetical protein
MLKIGAVRWRGKCSRHPMFDPFEGGRGAVKGGCPRCTTLVEIWEMHQKMLALMRTFVPPPLKKRKKPEPSQLPDLQIGLFEEVR